jgi:hypothetical protein
MEKTITIDGKDLIIYDFPQEVIDTILNEAKSIIDKKILYGFRWRQTQDTFLNRVNASLENSPYDIHQKTVLMYPTGRPKRYGDRILVCAEGNYYDFLTKRKIENVSMYITYYYISRSKENYVPLGEPTVFKESDRWEKFSHLLKVCADSAEENGFQDASKILNLLSKSQVKSTELMSVIPRKVFS